jgi:hypothetical protein
MTVRDYNFFNFIRCQARREAFIEASDLVQEFFPELAEQLNDKAARAHVDYATNTEDFIEDLEAVFRLHKKIIGYSDPKGAFLKKMFDERMLSFIFGSDKD